jgi:hypothetical protein
VIFFSLLSLNAYVLLLERKKYASLMLFISSALLFHSQHIYIGVLFPAVFLHALLFHRDKLKALAIVLAAVLIVNSPWLIWLLGINFAIPYGTNVMPLWLSVAKMIADIVHFVFPPMFLLFAIILFLFRFFKYKKLCADKKFALDRISLPIFFIIFNMIIILIVSPFPFFRYMGPSIPLLIILLSLVVDAALSTNSIFAGAAVILLIWTQVLAGDFKNYIYEITHDFDGPIKGICKYLNEHGSPDDTVAITYGDMPLKFYTKMRVIGGLTGESLEPAKDAKWVIIRKYDNCSKDIEVKRFLLQNVDFTKYRAVTIDYPDTLNENREDPAKHYFRTQSYEDRVTIFERINQ